MVSLDDKREYARRRISEFQDQVRKSESLNNQKGLSLYVTGSFARGEAGAHSDIDLFLITDSAFQPAAVSNQDLTLIHADLHNAAVGMGFPPFSKDMEYLKPHSLDDILSVLGSPADDFYNHFTARMLLLLESKCIFNEMVYENSITQIILAYYRDYHDHRESFVPLFLVNDIHRYWRTLCLNYEHNRNKVPASGDDKHKYHVMNLKLKFSRMLTCFSAIIPLSRPDVIADPDRVRALTREQPLARLSQFADDVPSARGAYAVVEAEYVWFLETIDRPRDALQEWIGEKEHREAAFKRARAFRDAIYELLKAAAGDGQGLRLLVV